MIMIDNNYSLLFSILILTSLFWRYVQTKRSTAQQLAMPYPNQTSWIWGHELEIFQHEASEMYIKWAASIGLVYRIKAALFQPDIIIVGDNSAAQHILQNSNRYVKAPAFLRLITRHIGKGLVCVEGEDHKYQRRLLAPAFTSSAVEAMADDIFSCVDKMTQNLRSTLIATGETNDDIVDVVPIMSACTLDIIGRVGFGHDFEGGKSTEGRAISSAWRHDMVMTRTFTGFVAPIVINVFPWIIKFPIAAFRDGVVRRIIHKLAGKLISDNSKNMNVLHVHDKRDKSEARLTTVELLDNTTAVTVDFILLQLARNPSIQRKLQQEIRSVASLDYSTIVGLEYLNAVAKEGLRLHPVGAPTERIALRDDVIPLNQAIRTGSGEMVSSFTIKAGQVFRIPWTVLNTNQQVWGNNADEFIPERWIEPGGILPPNKLPHGPWAGVSSFSDGPRSCIGFRLAVLELKIIIAALVRSFEFEPTEAKIIQQLSLSLQPFADGKVSSMPLKVTLAPEL
ncbi:cytochrome P450 [Rhodocollybia butyracea]|uniref:Cytochrome P450 n=1 Tax=Rhodocollybia butyracea TaxID=206335 RepID=A0A9P5PS53_9AGAR|nr:cytochrome P450 [Rhodocollybia butyracea]